MPKKDYKSQYLHPKWQKKRLEILERDQYKCAICGSGEKTLHVHHLSYESGKDVWDYRNAWLITHCEDCHKEQHNQQKCIEDININEYREMIDIIISSYLGDEKEMDMYLKEASLFVSLGSFPVFDGMMDSDDNYDEDPLSSYNFFLSCIKAGLKHEEIEGHARLCLIYGYIWHPEYMRYRWGKDCE